MQPTLSQSLCNAQLRHISSYAPTFHTDYLKTADFTEFPHIPQFDSSILPTTKELVGIIGKAYGHDRLLMGFKTVYQFGTIEHSYHGIFKGSGDDAFVRYYPKYTK